MVETFRFHVERNQLAEVPNSRRAWGFLSTKAARESLIKYIGTSKVLNKTAHRANAGLWMKV